MLTTHNSISRWMIAVRVKQHLRNCVSAIPPLPPLLSLPWQLDILSPIEKRRRLELPSSAETEESLKLSRTLREKRR